MQLGCLDVAQADYIVRKYMEKERGDKRRLEDSQANALMQLVDTRPITPLHFRLLSAEFLEWKSWQTASISRNSSSSSSNNTDTGGGGGEALLVSGQDTLADAFERRVMRVERACGLVFTRHLLGYVTIGAAKSGAGGFSQCELQDLMSLDDEVAREFHSSSANSDDNKPTSFATVMRVPWHHIVRALNELHDAWLLTTRPCHGVYTVGWRHRIFVELAKRRYFGTQQQQHQQAPLVAHLHRNVAEYLMGTWAAPALKPLFYDQRIVPNLDPDASGQTGAASGSQLVFDKPTVRRVRVHLARLVPAQPTLYEPFHTHIRARYNLRKLSLLPTHLARAGMREQLRTLVLFNVEWMYAKLEAFGLHELLADFALVRHEASELEARLVAKCLKMSEAGI